MKKNKVVMVFIFSICKLCYSFNGDIAPFNDPSRAYIGMVFSDVAYNRTVNNIDVCGGTLITRGKKNYFITAYHCLEGRYLPHNTTLDKSFIPEGIEVYLPPVGRRNSNMKMSNPLFAASDSFAQFWASFTEPLEIKRYKVNNIYYMNPKEWRLGDLPDLAVLEISGNVQRNNPTVEPIILDQDEMYNWGDTKAFGWAQNDYFEYGGELKFRTGININTYSYGHPKYGVIGTDSIGTHGDSGSPLIAYDNYKNAYIYGVASYIDGADFGKISYTNLALPPIHYWLRDVLAGKQIPSCTVGSTCNDYSLRPQGSYLDTCRGVKWNFPYLEANCKNYKGNYVLTSKINYFSRCYTGKSAKPYPSPSISTAGSTVSNMNGKLTCDVSTNVPPGDYLRTCQVYYWDGGTLSATCKKQSILGTTSKVNSSIIPGRCRKLRTDYNVPWIINDNGVLTCGRV